MKLEPMEVARARQKNGQHRPPLVSFTEFAELHGLFWRQLSQLAGYQTRIGNPPPEPKLRHKSARACNSWYDKRDLQAWMDSATLKPLQQGVS